MGKDQGAVKNSRDFTFHEENLFRPVVTRALRNLTRKRILSVNLLIYMASSAT